MKTAGSLARYVRLRWRLPNAALLSPGAAAQSPAPQASATGASVAEVGAEAAGDAATGGGEGFDVGFGVGCGEGPVPLGQIDIFEEQGEGQRLRGEDGVADCGVGYLVGAGEVGVGLVGEMDAEQGTAGKGLGSVAGAAGIDVLLKEGCLHRAAGLVAQGSQARVDLGLVVGEVGHQGPGGEHGGWVSRKGATGEADALVVLATDELQDVGASRHCGDGHSAAQGLAKGGQVRLDGVESADVAGAEAEACDYLVQDEEGAVTAGQLPGCVDVLAAGRNEAAGTDEGLEDKAGELIAVAAEVVAQQIDVVEAGDNDGVGEDGGKALTLELLKAGETGMAMDAFESPRVSAVPSASDLHDDVAPGEALGEHDGVHSGEGAAGGEAHALGTGLAAEDFGRLDLDAIGEASLEAPTVLEGAGESGGDHVGVVTEHVGEVALPEVEDGVTVLVPDGSSLGGDDAGRERLVEADGVAPAIDEAVQASFV